MLGGNPCSWNIWGQPAPIYHNSIGLKQGCPLSATLFGLFIDGLHQYLQDAVPDAGVRVQHLRVTDLIYADDISLLACTPQHLQALLDAMEAYCSAIHMTISSDKTKIMVLGDHALPSFTCSGQVVERVPSFKYLGLRFRESGLCLTL